MSHFYGTIQGNRGEATRCGTKNSGINVYAAGWAGCIHTTLYLGSDGLDYFRVWLEPWSSSGGYTRLLAEGELCAQKDKTTHLSHLTAPLELFLSRMKAYRALKRT